MYLTVEKHHQIIFWKMSELTLQQKLEKLHRKLFKKIAEGNLDMINKDMESLLKLKQLSIDLEEYEATAVIQKEINKLNEQSI